MNKTNHFFINGFGQFCCPKPVIPRTVNPVFYQRYLPLHPKPSKPVKAINPWIYQSILTSPQYHFNFHDIAPRKVLTQSPFHETTTISQRLSPSHRDYHHIAENTTLPENTTRSETKLSMRCQLEIYWGNYPLPESTAINQRISPYIREYLLLTENTTVPESTTLSQRIPLYQRTSKANNL